MACHSNVQWLRRHACVGYFRCFSLNRKWKTRQSLSCQKTVTKEGYSIQLVCAVPIFLRLDSDALGAFTCDYGCITYPRSPFSWGLIFRNTTLCRSHSHRVNSSFPGLLEHRNHNPEDVTQKNFVSYPHHLDKISSFSLLCLLCARSLRVLDSSRSAFRLQLDGSRRSQQGYVSGYVT